ncbi:MAG TPA: zf-HC2 domain-containing protein [Gemmatimonadales bacterium]|nr:zf-HC2 domain-containing protein [Gemmatimonadales bacterium]
MRSPNRDDRRDCASVVRDLWEYLDGRAGPANAEEITAHLEWCDGCRAHFAFEERLVQTLAQLRREHSDPVRLRAEVLGALQAAGFGRSREPEA